MWIGSALPGTRRCSSNPTLTLSLMLSTLTFTYLYNQTAVVCGQCIMGCYWWCSEWYSESGSVEHSSSSADESLRLSLLTLLMSETSSEWAWFNQCDVTLPHNLLTAQLTATCLFLLHLTFITRYLHSLSPYLCPIAILLFCLIQSRTSQPL